LTAATWQYLRKDEQVWYSYSLKTEKEIEMAYNLNPESDLYIKLGDTQ